MPIIELRETWACTSYATLVTTSHKPLVYLIPLKVKLKYLQDSYLSMIATYISFPLFGLNGLCIPQINSNFFEPRVGIEPTTCALQVRCSAN